MNSKKKIFLTGSSGFIGRNLREYFDGRYEIYAPSHKELELLDNKAVGDYLHSHKVDIVIHTATTPAHRKIKDSKDVAQKNLDMFFNIIENKNCFFKMILLGSGSEYDIRRNLLMARETDLPEHAPADESGYSKYTCSQVAEGSKNIVNLRPFGVFGKYEDYQIRFISNVICKSLFDLPLTIKQNRVFSYLYIDDLCRIVEHFMGNDSKYRNYNVVPDTTIDLFSIAQMVNAISGKNLKIIVKEPGMGRGYTGDNKRLKEEVDDFAFTPLEAAVKELYRWYEKHKNTIDSDLLRVDP